MFCANCSNIGPANAFEMFLFCLLFVLTFLSQLTTTLIMGNLNSTWATQLSSTGGARFSRPTIY